MNKREEFDQKCIDTHEHIFEKFPELEILPIYMWGRMYKYESAGESFDTPLCEYSTVSLPDSDSMEEHFSGINIEILESDDFEQYIIAYPPKIEYKRKEVVKLFGGWDDQGGQCIIIKKHPDGGYEIDSIDCDSGE